MANQNNTNQNNTNIEVGATYKAICSVDQFDEFGILGYCVEKDELCVIDSYDNFEVYIDGGSKYIYRDEFISGFIKI